MTAELDHLVFAVPDLEAGVARLESELGVRPTPGGRHPGLGTRNALLALSPTSYLEVIGPDPDGAPPKGPRPFAIDELVEGRLVGWAVKAPEIERRVAAARAAGVDPGDVRDMSRETPDGRRLAWRLTTPPPGVALVPFLIDWGSTPSPATTAASGCRLLELRGEHPDPTAIARRLRALGVELAVERGPAAALFARLEAPTGVVSLS